MMAWRLGVDLPPCDQRRVLAQFIHRSTCSYQPRRLYASLESCWCADCTDAAIDTETGEDIRPLHIQNPGTSRCECAVCVAARLPRRQIIAGPVGIAWVNEYGLTQKFTNTIKCF